MKFILTVLLIRSYENIIMMFDLSAAEKLENGWENGHRFRRLVWQVVQVTEMTHSSRSHPQQCLYRSDLCTAHRNQISTGVPLKANPECFWLLSGLSIMTSSSFWILNLTAEKIKHNYHFFKLHCDIDIFFVRKRTSFYLKLISKNIKNIKEYQLRYLLTFYRIYQSMQYSILISLIKFLPHLDFPIHWKLEYTNSSPKNETPLCRKRTRHDN